MGISIFDKGGLSTFPIDMRASGSIKLRPGGDINDYFTFSTTSNRPLITVTSTNDNPLCLGKDATNGHSLDADDVIFGEDVEIDGTLYADGTIVGGQVDSTQILYVDVGQTTSSGTGNRGDPYKTIGAAITAIIALADNSDTKAYVILVAPGTYTETLTLENAELYNLAFIAMGGSAGPGYSAGSGSVIMDPSSDPALESEASNTNLHYLYFKGFRWLGSIHLDGATQNTLFGEKGITFEDCSFEGFRNGAIHINLTNLERFSWVNGNIGRGTVLTAENIWSMSINGERYSDWPMDMSGGWTLTATTAENMPYHMDDENAGGDQMTFQINHAFLQMSSWTLAQGGTGVLRIQCRNGFMNGSFTAPSLGSVYGYNAIFNNNITMNANGTLFLYNSVVKGTLTRNGCAVNIYNNVES